MMRLKNAPALAAALCVLALGCTEKSSSKGPSTSLGFAFVEKSKQAGFGFVHTDGSTGRYNIVETLASGIALVDYDDDGDLDVYFLKGMPMPPSGPVRPKDGRKESNRFFRNEGDGTFTDVTAETGLAGAGFSIGCSAGDYDGDGDQDLYVSGFTSNFLYRNEGDGTFTDVTKEAGVDDERLSGASVFVDIDGDEDLDLYVANYCVVDLATVPCMNKGIPGYCPPANFKAESDVLFLNLGDGTFKNISEASGITAVARWGLGVIATDYNLDGRPDIYVANDVSDNFLFENLGEARFKNVALESGCALSTNGDEQGSMGVAGGDFNRDGEIDLSVTNYQRQLNCLYERDRALGFADMAMVKGLGEKSPPLVGWGVGFADFDNDGWQDLFVANGHLEDRIEEFDQGSTYLQQNQLFKNFNGKFREVTELGGPALAEVKSSRGAAFGDIDNDGDIDIVICNSRQRPSLLINEGGNRKAWVMFDLRGKKNVFALGARVTVEAAGVTQVAEVRSGGSYVCQNDLRLHFGLGDAEQVDRVTVLWPNAKTSVFENLKARQIHRVREE